MISGICHYHYSTRNLSITPEQCTRLACARTSSGVLEHLYVFVLSNSCCSSRMLIPYARVSLPMLLCCCAKRREVQLKRS